MSGIRKSVKLSRFGFSNKKKKIGVNYWRFFFNGVNVTTSTEKFFYIELEMLNPWISPKETVLGYTPRISFTPEDLQYALAGTQSAQNLQTETILQPSYCALRVGIMGENSKQLCTYFPVKDIKFNKKPFSIEIDNKLFSDERLCGFLTVTEQSLAEHPEFMCNSGSVSWNLAYSYEKDSDCGFASETTTWFPVGLKTKFAGSINFDGTDYIVDPKKCRGYVDRFWGKDFPKTLFHISSNSLTSIITGSQLFNSAFSVQGAFDNRISFIGKMEGINVDFCSDSNNKKISSLFECTQAPECEDPADNLLHWAVSINNKQWIIDIDVYCKIKELFNRTLELPEGGRKVLNVLESGSGYGEIKLYSKHGQNIEQIENATITKAICQFGRIDAESEN